MALLRPTLRRPGQPVEEGGEDRMGGPHARGGRGSGGGSGRPGGSSHSAGGGGTPAGGTGHPFAERSSPVRAAMKLARRSIGSGKIMVEFFSVAISVRVWR